MPVANRPATAGSRREDKAGTSCLGLAASRHATAGSRQRPFLAGSRDEIGQLRVRPAAAVQPFDNGDRSPRNNLGSSCRRAAKGLMPERDYSVGGGYPHSLGGDRHSLCLCWSVWSRREKK